MSGHQELFSVDSGYHYVWGERVSYTGTGLNRSYGKNFGSFLMCIRKFLKNTGCKQKNNKNFRNYLMVKST
jgi:hypothetical protein